MPATYICDRCQKKRSADQLVQRGILRVCTPEAPCTCEGGVHDSRVIITLEEQKLFGLSISKLFAPFKQLEGAARATTDDGFEYREFSSCKTEGSSADEPWYGWDTVHFSLEAALEAWSSRVTAYLFDKKTIWWRIRPEFDVQDHSIFVYDVTSDIFPFPLIARKQYKVYGRLYAE